MKELELTQVEQLKKIAGQLLAQREKQSVKLEQIATATYIPLRLLQALEEGHVERLPEPIYIQGFIRRYADFVGLDGTALSQEFPLMPPKLDLDPTLPAPTNSPAPPPLAVDVAATRANHLISNHHPTQSEHPISPTSNGIKAGLSEPSEPEKVQEAPLKTVQEAATPAERVEVKPSSPSVMLTAERSPLEQPSPTQRPLPWGPILGGLAVLVVGGVAVVALNQPKPQQAAESSHPSVSIGQSQPSPKQSPSPAIGSNLAEAGSQPTPTQVSPSPEATASQAADATPTDSTAPVQIAVKLTDEAWVSVTADGNVIYEGTLPKGSQKAWSAQKDLVIQSGNAGAVLLSFNQQQAKPMGQLGQVETQTFEPTGTKARP